MTEQIDDTNHYYEALERLNCPSTLEGKTTLRMHYAQEGQFHIKRLFKVAGRQIHNLRLSHFQRRQFNQRLRSGSDNEYTFSLRVIKPYSSNLATAV